jgi:hypothetical protein
MELESKSTALKSQEHEMELLFFDKGTDVPSEMQRAFFGQPYLIARQLPTHQIASYQELDALYLSLIAAERWGSRPLLYQSQVLRTECRDRQWPQFIIAGIALTPDDVRAGDCVAELKLTIEAVVQAVDSYNNQNGFPIKKIGFWTEDLGIHRMDPYEAGANHPVCI